MGAGTLGIGLGIAGLAATMGTLVWQQLRHGRAARQERDEEEVSRGVSRSDHTFLPVLLVQFLLLLLGWWVYDRLTGR